MMIRYHVTIIEDHLMMIEYRVIILLQSQELRFKRQPHQISSSQLGQPLFEE